MKKLAERLFAAMMLSVALFTACTEDEGTPEPNFPEAVSEWIDLEESNIYTLTLSPNQDWTVSIPATANDYWAILNGEQQVVSVGGGAGDAVVQIICLAGYNDLEDHSVEVSMRMGGETRVIATLHLAAGEPVFNIKSAQRDTDDEGHTFFVPGGETGFNYTYPQDPLEDDETIEMIWNASRNGYLAYIQVEANFNWRAVITPGIRVTRMENSNTNARFIEVEVFCSTINLSEESADHSFSIEPAPEAVQTRTVSLSAPQFTPQLEIRKAVADADSTNFVYATSDDSPYQWEYETDALTPVIEGTPADADKIDMLWRPTANANEVDSYILVRSNFTISISSEDDWMSIGEPSVVTETTTDYWNESIYRVYVESANLNTEGEEGSVTVSLPDTDFSQTFRVSTPDVTDAFYVVTAPTFQFDAEGEYVPGEMTTSTNATVEITSAQGVQIAKFERQNGYYYYMDDDNSWINPDYGWNSGSQLKIQSNTLTVEVSDNTGEDAREGLVMAFPAKVWEDVQTAAENSGNDIELVLFAYGYDGSTIRPAYTQYAVAYVNQAGQPGAIEPYLLNEDWSMVGSTFGKLPADDIFVSNTGLQESYLITYTYEDIETIPTIGAECPFSINVEYDSIQYIGEDMTPVENSWVQLEKANTEYYGSDKYYLAATPGTLEAKSIYVVFVNGSDFVACIKLSYSPGGASSLNLSFYNGTESNFTLEELTGDNRPSGVTNPCWRLTCTNPDGGMTLISGLPSNFIFWGQSEWLSITPMAGMSMFDINPSLVTAEDNECQVTIAESTGNILCVMIIRATVAE